MTDLTNDNFTFFSTNGDEALMIMVDDRDKYEVLRKQILDTQEKLNIIKATAILTISMKPDHDLKKGMETILKIIEDDLE